MAQPTASPVPQAQPVAAEAAQALLHAAAAGATLCWDTETSGLVGHVIQIAVVAVPRGAVCGADGTLPDCVCYCRYWSLPPQVALDPRAVAVHGITRAQLAARGCPVLPELRALADVVHAGRRGGARWVAHNANFDVARLNHTAAFHGEPPLLTRAEVLCTMLRSAAPCGAKSRTGRAKAPTCSELFEHLFKRPFQGALHDALGDAPLLASCFLGGRRRGWWD